MPSSRPPSSFAAIAAIAQKIPKGRVVTYGQLAAYAGMPRSPRIVGYAMTALGDEVPWQRVLGTAKPGFARISMADPVGRGMQRAMLEQEGVEFDERGRIDLERFGWEPRAPVAKKRPAKSSP